MCGFGLAERGKSMIDLPDPKAVPIVNHAKARPVDLGVLVDVVLDAVDGVVNIEEIGEQCGIETDLAQRIILSLYNRGLLILTGTGLIFAKTKNHGALRAKNSHSRSIGALRRTDPYTAAVKARAKYEKLRRSWEQKRLERAFGPKKSNQQHSEEDGSIFEESGAEIENRPSGKPEDDFWATYEKGDKL